MLSIFGMRILLIKKLRQAGLYAIPKCPQEEERHPHSRPLKVMLAALALLGYP
jgi:hypothetical protein